MSRGIPQSLRFICIAISFAAVTALSAAAQTAYVTKVNTNMRTGAGQGNGIVTTIPRGRCALHLGPKKGRWRNIWYAGRSGWSSVRLLKQDRRCRRLRAKASVNLRARPTKNSARVNTVGKGKCVRWLGGISGRWIEALFSGDAGWLSGRYVSMRKC